jgi:hypothetical protein
MSDNNTVNACLAGQFRTPIANRYEGQNDQLYQQDNQKCDGVKSGRRNTGTSINGTLQVMLLSGVG